MISGNHGVLVCGGGDISLRQDLRIWSALHNMYLGGELSSAVTNERTFLHPPDQSEGRCFNPVGGGVGVDTGALYPS